MKYEALDVLHGSVDVFRDLKHENADVARLKAILALEMIIGSCIVNSPRANRAAAATTINTTVGTPFTT